MTCSTCLSLYSSSYGLLLATVIDSWVTCVQMTLSVIVIVCVTAMLVCVCCIVTNHQLIAVTVLWQFILYLYVIGYRDSSKADEQSPEMTVSKSGTLKVQCVPYFTVVVIGNQSSIGLVIMLLWRTLYFLSIMFWCCWLSSCKTSTLQLSIQWRSDVCLISRYWQPV